MVSIMGYEHFLHSFGTSPVYQANNFEYFEPAMTLLNLEWNDSPGFCTEFYENPIATFRRAFLLYAGWGIGDFYLRLVMFPYRWQERLYNPI